VRRWWISRISEAGDMNLLISEISGIPALNATYTGDAGALKKEINRVSIDSREIREGDIFFAIRGERFDAHQFIEAVFAKGASAVVVDKAWFTSQPVRTGNFIVVDDTLTALQETSHYYRSKFDIPYIAITGSNGKTTTKEMVVRVLSHQCEVLSSRGNLNNHIGVPLTLFGLDSAHNIAVIEMGCNHFKEIERLAQIADPQYGLITNIGPAHIEFFGSLDGVAQAKTELWHYLEGRQGTAFVNNDDPYLARMHPEAGKVVTYGFENPADNQGRLERINDNGCPVFSVMGVEIELQIAGEHNIYNAMAGIAIGLEFGMEIKDIADSLRDFSPASKRMEIIRPGDITILNDCYNSNFVSAEKSLKTLAQIRTGGRKIGILSDMLELGHQSEYYHRRIGTVAADIDIDALYTYGPHSAYTHEEAKKRGVKNARHFDTKEEMIEALQNDIEKDDVILIKGSRGMAMEEVTEALVRIFER
jgi:UDP-N-acetylmuramoyl-tripeptide--D-alanyl-D-alanine ligase